MCCLILILFLSPLAFAKPKNTGTLQLFSEIGPVSIYIDGQLKSRTAAFKKDLPAGEHYIKALAEKSGEIVYNEVVIIKKGGLKTIVIESTAAEPEQPAAAVSPYLDEVGVNPFDGFYHLPGAYHLSGLQTYKLKLPEAEKKGYAPCETCFPWLVKKPPPAAPAPTPESEPVETGKKNNVFQR